MARCPRVVKINGSRWNLYTDKRSWDTYGADDSLGRTFGTLHVMAVNPQVVNPDEHASTVMHEVLHAAWWHSFPDNDRDDYTQEGVVGGLERALYSVIRDNPKLVAYLRDPEPLG